MGGFTTLYIDQGANFENSILLTDDVTNQPINVASYNVTSYMRRSHISPNTSANIICTITDAANGEITMTLAANVTANLVAGAYVFDVKTVVGSVTTRPLEGTIIVNPSVTRG